MLEQKQVEALKLWGKKFFDKDNQDYQTLDFEAEIDRSLSLEQNKELLREKIRKQINFYSIENISQLKKEVEIMPKEKFKIEVDNEIHRAEVQAELEFNKTLEKIEADKTTNFIEDVYFMPKQFTKMVANGNSKGLILYGEAGLGKSYSVMRAFREADKKFVYLSGHITPLELYQFLFEHRTEHIVLDDVNILDNKINLNMLKACLNDNSRLVSYNTSSAKLKVPNKFIFEGSIILLMNKKPRGNEDLKAVESRVLNYELSLDYATKIKVIYELARHQYKDIAEVERQKIVSWIRENTSCATTNLSLRLLFMIYEFYRFDDKNWDKMALKIIEKDELKELIDKGLTEKEWCEKTGLSRRSYYIHKKTAGIEKWR